MRIDFDELRVFDQRVVMFPRGRVKHYAEDLEGFQQVRLLCGRIVNLFEMNQTFDDWGQTRYCHNCLKVRLGK